MNNYVTVYVANGQLDAEMIHGFLEAAGFTALISQESVGKVYGLTFGPLGEVNILVPESQKDAAINLLQLMERGDLVDDHANIDKDDES
jgi:hypothetical protein